MEWNEKQKERGARKMNTNVHRMRVICLGHIVFCIFCNSWDMPQILTAYHTLERRNDYFIQKIGERFNSYTPPLAWKIQQAQHR